MATKKWLLIFDFCSYFLGTFNNNLKNGVNFEKLGLFNVQIYFQHSKISWIDMKNPEPLFLWKYSQDFKTLFGFVLAQKLWLQTQIE